MILHLWLTPKLVELLEIVHCDWPHQQSLRPDVWPFWHRRNGLDGHSDAVAEPWHDAELLGLDSDM